MKKETKIIKLIPKKIYQDNSEKFDNSSSLITNNLSQEELKELYQKILDRKPI